MKLLKIFEQTDKIKPILSRRTFYSFKNNLKFLQNLCKISLSFATEKHKLIVISSKKLQLFPKFSKFRFKVGRSSKNTHIPTKQYLFSISEAAKFLGISADTLRNWEERGKLIPERTKGGSRRYRLEQLKQILADKNPYLVKNIPDLFKTPPSTSVPPIFKRKLAFNFLAVFLISILIFWAGAALLAFRIQKVKSLTLTHPYLADQKQRSTEIESKGEVLAAQSSPSPIAQFVNFIFSPFKIITETIQQAAPAGKIRDINDILTVDEQGNLVPKVSIKLPDLTYLKVEAAKPGEQPQILTEKIITKEIIQQIATAPAIIQQIFTEAGGIKDIKSDSARLTVSTADNTSTLKLDLSGISANISTDSIKTEYIKDGAVTNSKLSQITDSNKIAGSAVQLKSGGGLADSSGLSLSRSCSSNQILVWSGSSWICSDQSGGSQTPWTSNIDAAGYNLTGAAIINTTGNMGVGGSLVVSGNVGIGISLSVTDLIYAKKGLRVDGFSDLTGNVGVGGLLTLSSSGIISGGLSSCSGSNSKLLWSSSTNNFSCGTDLNTGGGGGAGGWVDYGSTVGLQTITANVGIGTSPSVANAKLQIQGSGDLTVPTFYTTNNSNSQFGLAVLDNGNVGIGTTLPGSRLGVAGSVGIGVSFANSATPSNGLAVQGNVGIGTTSVNASLIVAGNVGIGWTGVNANISGLGLSVFGNVGIGTTSPKFALDIIGNVNIGSSLNVNGTNGLVNTSNLNVSGTSSLGTAYATTLTSSGNVGVGGSLTVTSGTSLSSSLSVTGNTNLSTLTAAATNLTGTLTSIGNGLDITTGINEALTIIPNGVGNVGIGYSSPYGRLFVLGSGTGTGIVFQTTSSTQTQGFTILDNGNVGIGTTNPAQIFQINPSGLASFVVTSLGSIGVGWTSPLLTVSITGNVGIGPSFARSSLSNGTYLAVEANVGIGTTSPAFPLHVIGNVGIGTSLTVTSLANLGGLNVSGTSSLGTGYGSTLTISGNTGIGGSLTTTSLDYASGGLRVNGYSDLTGNVGIGSSLNVVSGATFSSFINAGSLLGAGLTSCSDTTNSKLLYNSQTGQFSCGSDQNSGGGGGAGGWIDFGTTVGLQTQTDNVGIGTSPSVANAKLQIQGSGDSTALTFYTTNNSNSQFGLVVLDNGKVGIGTTLPDYNFRVNGTGLFTGFVGIGSSLSVTGNVGIGQSLTVSSTGAFRLSGQTNCTNLTNGGKLTTDSSGNVYCDNDSGGGGLTGGIAGAVTFWTSSSAVSANTNFLWDSANMRLGIGSSASANALGVFGSVGIGTSFAGTFLPGSLSNGLAIQGNVAIGTTSTNTTLNVAGNVAIGWTGANISPNISGLGLSIFGNVGIGTTTPTFPLQVIGNVGIGSSITVTGLTYLSGGVRVNGYSDLTGNVGVGGTAVFNSAAVISSLGSGIVQSNANGGLSSGPVNLGSSTFVNGTLGVSNGGSGTSTQFTQGSVVFAGANGIYSQNAKAFFWNDGLNKLGIGSSAPGATLGIFGNVGIGSSYGYATLPSAVNNGLVVEGNIGIGTSNPTASLYVAGNAGIGWTGVNLGSAIPSLGLSIYGNVGIGTTTTTFALDVVGNVGIRGSLTLQAIGAFRLAGQTNCTNLNNGGKLTTDSNGNVYCDNDTSGSSLSGGVTNLAAIWQSASTLGVGLIYDSGANVGIATSAPLARLDIRGAANAGNLAFLIRGTGSTNQFGLAVTDAGNVGIGYTIGPANGLAVFGNVGIGATTANSALTVNGGVSIGSGFNVTAPTNGLIVQGNVGIATTSPSQIFQVNYSSVNPVVITSGGNVGIGFTTPNASLFVVGNVGIGWTGNANLGASIPGLGLAVYGNVGIGTTTTNFALDVVGNVNVGSSLTVQAIGAFRLAGQTNCTNLTNGGKLTTDSNGNVYCDNDSGGSLSGGITNLAAIWKSASTLGVGIIYDSGANVGIGTSSPIGRFDIRGAGNAGNLALLTYGTGSTNQFGLSVTDVGNVGIGVTNPSSSLSVFGNVGIGWTGGPTASIPGLGLSVFGNVGIGTTSPASALQVVGNGTMAADFINGNVGLGIANASDALHIIGNFRIDNNTDSTNKGCIKYDGSLNELTYSQDCTTFVRFQNIGVGSSVGGGWVDTGQIVNLININDSLGIGFSVVNTSLAKLGILGNVGIGASSPNATLTVQGNVGIGYTGATSVIPANGLAVFGNVGIGTTTANANLSIVGSAIIGNGSGGFGNKAAPANGLAVEGNVGIGVSTTLAALHVNANPVGTPAMLAGLFQNGNVGIGTTANGGMALAVNGNLLLSDNTVNPSAGANSGGANGSFWIGSNTAGGNATGRIWVRSVGVLYRFNSVSNVADYSEYIAQSEPSEPGDVMVVDEANSQTVKKSSHPYEQNILGVITRYGTGYNNFNEDRYGANWANVGMLGQVFVKVSTENGPIHVGDRLTTSSISGVAMKATKAGQIIGRALEAFDGTNTSDVCNTPGVGSDSPGVSADVACGQILVLVSPSYFDPDTDNANDLAQLTIDAQNTASYSAQIPYGQPSSENNFGKYSIQDIFGHILDKMGKFSNALIGNLKTGSVSSKELNSDLMKVDQAGFNKILVREASISALNVESINFGGQSVNLLDLTSKMSVLEQKVDILESATPSATVASLELTPPEILIATQSATLVDLSVQSDATISGKLTAYEGIFQQTFKSLGQSILGKTTIAGDLTVDGTLAIENGSEINVLGTLFLQKSPLAEDLDIFAGQVKISKEGLLTVQKLAISSKTLGSSTIPAGQTKVTINNDQITDKSKVFITPHKPVLIGVTNKDVGAKNFTVEMDKSQDTDVDFDWWIVDSGD